MLGFEEPILTTANDTVTNLLAFPVRSGGVVTLKGVVWASNAAGDRYFADFVACAQNKAGTTTLVYENVTEDVDNLACALTVDADNATDTIRVRATGIAATSINWHGYIWTTDDLGV